MAMLDQIRKDCSTQGWNTYTAAPVTQAAINAANAEDRYIPTNDGGVAVQWNVGDSEVIVEFGPDGRVMDVSWSREV